MNHNEGNYEPLGVSWLGSKGLRIMYRMVEALSVGRFLTWSPSFYHLWMVTLRGIRGARSNGDALPSGDSRACSGGRGIRGVSARCG